MASKAAFQPGSSKIDTETRSIAAYCGAKEKKNKLSEGFSVPLYCHACLYVYIMRQ